MMSVKRFLSPDIHSVMGMNRRNIELVMTRNRRVDFPLADNKLATKEMLGAANISVAPTLATFSSFYEVRRFEEHIAELESFVIKPARGSGGDGIIVIAEKRRGMFQTAGGRLLTGDNIQRHIADVVFGVYSLDKSDVAIVEPRLMPDTFFAALYPYGLSDIRLLLVDEQLTLSMIRVPTAESDGRANLHQGAIGIAIDIDSGKTYRAWHRKKEISHHPETGMELLNRQVPAWKRLKSIAVEAAKLLPLKFLGVDMVVDKTLGPLILEVNARPGIEIQNVTGVSLRSVICSSGERI